MKNATKTLSCLIMCFVLLIMLSACTKGEPQWRPNGQPNETETIEAAETQGQSPILMGDEQPQNSNLPENTFTALMPKIRIPVKEVIDNEFGTTAVYAAITSADFNTIVKAAKKNGFDVEASEENLSYIAKNENGMFIKIVVAQDATKISVFNDIKHFS